MTGQNPNQSPAGSFDFWGTTQGQAFVSPNEFWNIPNWMNEVDFQHQLFNSAEVFTPQTRNSNFNRANAAVIQQRGIRIDSDVLTPRDASDRPSLPEIDWNRRMQEAGLEIGLRQQMRDAIREINQIDEYCRAFGSDCGHYQERREELQKQLDEAISELAKLNREEAEKRINEREESLEQYRQDLRNCPAYDGFCRLNAERAIERTERELAELKSVHENRDYHGEVAQQAARIENEIQISRIDVIDNRLERINERIESGVTTAELHRLLNEATALHTERIAINAYEWLQDNKEAIIATTVDIGGQIVIIYVAGKLAVPTGGLSTKAAPYAGVAWSAYVNERYRGQDRDVAVANALIGGMAGEVVSALLPARTVFHMNPAGQLAYITPIKGVEHHTASIAASNTTSMITGFVFKSNK
jgi:hypothetical protein